MTDPESETETADTNTDTQTHTQTDDDGREWHEATKRPVTVEWCGPFEDPGVVETLEGDFEVSEQYIEEHGGFVIIRGVRGEVYPCALDIFHDTYKIQDEGDVPGSYLPAEVTDE